MAPAGLVAPRYGTASLAEVMPSAAAALGVPGTDDVLGLGGLVPAPRAVVVVLVDGLGLNLLRERSGHAPYLRSLLAASHTGVPAELAIGFPTTTATGLATLGTGSPPGRHGIVGFDVLDPERQRIVNQLAHWPADLDPLRWQPNPTVFERAVDAGVDVARIGPKGFAASGLTVAALRGGAYTPADTLQARVNAAISHAIRSERLLVYLYWGDLDRAGHDRGCQSLEWTRQLEDVDAALARLSAALPAGCLVVVTADHGMVDVADADRLDIAELPQLQRGVLRSAGEPRALYLWPETGQGAAVQERWRAQLGKAADVLTRDEAVAAGWFGASPRPAALARAGELLVVVRDPIVVFDSARQRPDVKKLIGWHGGLTEEEALVPLLVDAR